MSHYLRFRDNEEELETDSSDDEYDKNEKRLLNKIRNNKRKESESETEVFSVGSEDDSDEKSDDNQSDIALSDVEGQEADNDLPDAKAWGKDKRKYYGADYVDPDYGGYQEKDVQAAEMEGEEVKNLQTQFEQQLFDNDFSLDDIFREKDNEEVKDQNKEPLQADISKLTIKQKLKILQKESPEFFPLIEDFKAKMIIAKDFLHPIVQKFRSGDIEKCTAIEFVQTYYELILNYITNIYMYLLLKANRELKNHPILQRLYQYRQLLSQTEPVFDEIIKPQIQILLHGHFGEISIEKQGQSKPKKKKVLNILAKQQSTSQSKKTKTVSDSTQLSKKIKLEANLKRTSQITFRSEDSDKEIEKESDKVNMEVNESDLHDQKIEENDEETEGVVKRAITYQISKNKGLTPHRKKENRNPRVKHRLKFRKALIRRKGAVREPRKELKKYSGEISGIKTSVSKSIKFKS